MLVPAYRRSNAVIRTNPDPMRGPDRPLVPYRCRGGGVPLYTLFLRPIGPRTCPMYRFHLIFYRIDGAYRRTSYFCGILGPSQVWEAS